MWTCRLCHWDVALDDVALKFVSGMVICVKCFARETQTDKQMSATVRRDATQSVNEVPM